MEVADEEIEVVIEDEKEDHLEVVSEETVEEVIDLDHLVVQEIKMPLKQDLSKNQIKTDLEIEKLDSFPLESLKQIDKKDASSSTRAG